MSKDAANIQLAFAELEIRYQCYNKHAARSIMPESHASDLFNHMSDLRASESLGEFVSLGKKVEIDSKDGEIILHFSGGRVVFKPNHKKISVNQDGSFDMNRIWRIQILRLELI